MKKIHFLAAAVCAIWKKQSPILTIKPCICDPYFLFSSTSNYIAAQQQYCRLEISNFLTTWLSPVSLKIRNKTATTIFAYCRSISVKHIGNQFSNSKSRFVVAKMATARRCRLIYDWLACHFGSIYNQFLCNLLYISVSSFLLPFVILLPNE